MDPFVGKVEGELEKKTPSELSKEKIDLYPGERGYARRYGEERGVKNGEGMV